ncbi:MAG: dockerin type I repeat-containing protein [Lachnospiraceae bacterium]|uniref:dockerin type I repeat-containing protein n=1 Tax=Ruminococcus sp. TaxID=41978 RepID=UPI0025FD856E|nr:dockerin type I repeat-containing protein [Ruminococcus sp.]MBO4867354.1 dockerin type I repeat-containing protein [Ruminococcus sp.]MBR5179830.1 dockerin type I repeat-containing protein [Lachnospiraceae bacterium]
MKTMKKRIISLAMAAVSAVTMISSGITASAWDKQPIKYVDPTVNYRWDNEYKIYKIEHLTGDLNRDYVINVADYSILAAFVKGKYHGNQKIWEFGNGGNIFYQYQFIKVFGDINYDGNIDVTDLVLLSAHIKGEKFITDKDPYLAVC